MLATNIKEKRFQVLENNSVYFLVDSCFQIYDKGSPSVIVRGKDRDQLEAIAAQLNSLEDANQNWIHEPEVWVPVSEVALATCC